MYGENEKFLSWVLFIELYEFVLSETIDNLRKLHKTNIFGMPPKILP